jgi:hypothetical protein
MNTNGIAKHYETLTPLERLPLIVAACYRRDDVEAERLARSAPRLGFQLPDHHGLAEALFVSIVFHVMTQLDRIALFWNGEGLVESWHTFGSKEQGAKAKQLADLVRMMGRTITVEAEGWKRFCSELHVDPQTLLRDLPVYSTLERGEEAARINAFSDEEAGAFLRKEFGEDAMPRDIEDAAKEMRTFLDTWNERWA